MNSFTLDPASLQRLNRIHPDVAARVKRVLVAMYEAEGRVMRVTEGLRTFEYQQMLYAQGRTAMGRLCKCRGVVTPGKCSKHPLGLKVTNAEPGKSWHHYGLAVDCCFVGNDPYLEKESDEESNRIWRLFGDLAEHEGLVWGGDFDGDGKVDREDFDKPHLQKTYGLTLAACQELYAVNGCEAVWSHVNQAAPD